MRTDCVLFGAGTESLCSCNLGMCQSPELKGHLYCKLKAVITRNKKLPFCCFEHRQVDSVVWRIRRRRGTHDRCSKVGLTCDVL